VIEINYAQIRHYDTANGIGIRSSIFFSGCTHNCHNCFNKAYHDFKYGNEFTNKEINIIKEYMKEDQINGITLLGGEPLQQNPIEMINFLKDIRSIIDEYNKSIWIYSGYTYEEIILEKEKFSIEAIERKNIYLLNTKFMLMRLGKEEIYLYVIKTDNGKKYKLYKQTKGYFKSVYAKCTNDTSLPIAMQKLSKISNIKKGK